MNNKMSLYMDNSFKLSYEMLFQNGTSDEETETAVQDEERIYSSQEVEELLEKRDRQWEKKLENEREEAQRTGFEKGHAEGTQEAQALIEKQLSSINKMIKNLNIEFNQALEELKPHIAGLVFEITEKVLDIPFQHPKLQQRVHEEVRQLVEKLDEELHIKVTLAKADFEIVQQALEQGGRIDNVSFRIDEEHSPGEYAIETKKECIIKNFNKMVADFRESISFSEVDALQLDS